MDNVSIGRTELFDGRLNNWVLCDDQSLVDGPHTLTVRVRSAGQTFWLDHIQYTPSADVSLESALVKVDNLDPEIIYGSEWQPLGDSANLTDVTGTKLSFNFIG